MKTTGIFRLYEPVEENLINDAKTIKENTGMDVIFLRDSEGDLWHEVQYQFHSKTMKVVFDERGVIIMFSKDATLLNPVDCAVAEVSVKTSLLNWMNPRNGCLLMGRLKSAFILKKNAEIKQS